MSNLDDKLKMLDTTQEQIKAFESQKNEFATQQKILSKENEELKLKFSHLLDQFQEYVNETERKVEMETQAQKQVQDKILQDLNQTIKELEEMSRGLQIEGEEKDQQINQMA